MTPVETTLDVALPEMEPKSDEAVTAILAEPPRVPAHECGGDVGEEPGAAGKVEQVAEVDKGDDDGGSHGEGYPHQRVGVEAQVDHQPVDVHVAPLELAGDKVAHKAKGEERQQEDEQHGAGGAPHPFRHQHQDHRASHQGVAGARVELLEDPFVVPAQVGAYQHAGDCRQRVEPGHAQAFRPQRSWLEDVEGSECQAEQREQALLGKDHDADGAIEVGGLSQGRGRQQSAEQAPGDPHRPGRERALDGVSVTAGHGEDSRSRSFRAATYPCSL